MSEIILQDQRQLRSFRDKSEKTHLVNLHKKDKDHFGTAEGAVGPLEASFRQPDFKPLVFGTFAETSSNVRDFIETTVEYRMERLGRTVAATTVDAVHIALRRRYMTQLAIVELSVGQDLVCGDGDGRHQQGIGQAGDAG